ncbi:MAG: hypothetical protein L6422_02890 [Candidatus Marinimicrobia bacterium]|nr:hypothetical protein [bacterium]MCG2715225.1 hypothetical protein [Candidatus Neomarinimicrobiota bacterium]
MEALAEILSKLEHLERSLQVQNSTWLDITGLLNIYIYQRVNWINSFPAVIFRLGELVKVKTLKYCFPVDHWTRNMCPQ